MANLANSVKAMAVAVGGSGMERTGMERTARELELGRGRQQVRENVAAWRERHGADEKAVLAAAERFASAVMGDMLRGGDEEFGWTLLAELAELGL